VFGALTTDWQIVFCMTGGAAAAGKTIYERSQ